MADRDAASPASSGAGPEDSGPDPPGPDTEEVCLGRAAPTMRLPPPDPPGAEPSPHDGLRTVLLPPEGASAAAATHPAARPDRVAEMRDQAGARFGRYQLLSELGHGGMGIVWKAWDTSLQRTVALKQILARKGSAPDSVERFMREARLAAKLKHPHIVGVHDVGVHEGQHYFTTDYIEGTTLTRRLAERAPVRQVAEWIRQIALALHHAHECAVVHRDVKPENILIDGQDRAFVTDFGLAKEVELSEVFQQRSLTVSGALVGTPEYMSPEQAAGGQQTVGPPADQFALGGVLYLALAGRPPFQGRNLRELLNAITEADPTRPGSLQRNLDRDLETICLKMLEKDPRRRYASLAEAAADLERWAGGEPIRARSLGGAQRAWRWMRRHRTAAVSAGAGLLIAVGLGIWLIGVRAEHARRLTQALGNAESSERAAGSAAEEAVDRVLGEARDAYLQAIALAPGHAAAQAGLDRVEGRQQERVERGKRMRAAEEQARTHLDRARSLLDPALRYLYDARAEYAELVRRVDSAQQSVEAALALAPHLAEGHHLLGWAWELKGWEERAEKAWRAAIERDPTHALSRFRLGRLLLTRAFLASTTGIDAELADGRTQSAALAEEARAQFEAAAVGPGRAALESESQTWRDASLALMALVERRYSDVREACNRALDRDGEEGKEEVQWLLGCAQTEPKLALHAFTRALERRPKFALALYCRAFTLAAAGRFHEAHADYSAAIEIHPRLVPAWINRARLKRRLGDPKGALADCQAALAVDPESVWARQSRGWLLHQRGDCAAALADYDFVVERQPRWVEGRICRALACYAVGRLEEAAKEFDRALALNPERADALRGRGILLLAQGQFAAAAADLEQAVQTAGRERGGDWAESRDLAQRARQAAAEAERNQAPGWLRALAGATAVLPRGDWGAAREVFERALLEGDAAPDPTGAWRDFRIAGHYNLGCIYAQLSLGPRMDDGQRKALAESEAEHLRGLAFRSLEAAVRLGWSDAGHLEKDSDLDPLRKDPRWPAFAASLRR